jgi:hypothetical protein
MLVCSPLAHYILKSVSNQRGKFIFNIDNAVILVYSVLKAVSKICDNKGTTLRDRFQERAGRWFTLVYELPPVKKHRLLF